MIPNDVLTDNSRLMILLKHHIWNLCVYKKVLDDEVTLKDYQISEFINLNIAVLEGIMDKINKKKDIFIFDENGVKGYNEETLFYHICEEQMPETEDVDYTPSMYEEEISRTNPYDYRY